MNASVHVHPLSFPDFARPSKGRAVWPYIVGAVAALAIAASGALAVIANLEIRALLRNFDHYATADFDAVMQVQVAAAIFVLAGHGIAIAAFVGLAAHGHRTGLALLGSVVATLALLGAFVLGHHEAKVMLFYYGFASIVVLIGIGLVRDIGAAARTLAFIAAFFALATRFDGPEILASATSAAAYLAVALRMRALRVAPY